MGHMTLVQCGRSHSVTAACLVAQDLLFASLLRLVHWIHRNTVLVNKDQATWPLHMYPLLHVLLLQVDSPAQLANVLVNVTDNSEEIESADVSLTVGFLSVVTNSTEDLEQKDVSSHRS